MSLFSYVCVDSIHTITIVMAKEGVAVIAKNIFIVMLRMIMTEIHAFSKYYIDNSKAISI